jgi:hypothetical protein
VSDETKEVVVEKTGVNVAAIIVAITLLLAVLAVLHSLGMI